jgi:phage tail sheath gpL-like
MSISFSQIPIDVRVPGHYLEFDPSRAVGGLPAIHHKILVLGQRLAAGSVAEGVPTRITSAGQAEAAFGRGSMLSAMFAALKAANHYTETWAIALDDAAAGVAATHTVTVTGPAAAAGTINLYVGGIQVQAAVGAGDTANTIAAAIHSALDARADLPVTSAVATNVVTLTFRHKGEAGTALDIRDSYHFGEALPAGVALAYAAGVAGSGNPSIATALTAMGAEQYHTLITPWTDAANLTALETELSARWGPMVQKEGLAFAAAAGTHSAIGTLGASRNSPHLSILGSGASPTPPWIWAAVAGAVDAYEPDPARPRQTLALPGCLPPAPEDRFTLEEQNILLYDGISTYAVDPGGLCTLQRLITTYQVNAAGVADISYLDVETLRTLAYLRFSVRSRIALKFPRHKLASDGASFGAGQAIVTPRIIRAELIALFRQWEDAGLAEDGEQFKTDLIVERNGSDPNRVDALIPPNVINQFRVFAAAIQFRL